MKPDPSDPFRERSPRVLRRVFRVLGCALRVRADDARLMALAEAGLVTAERGGRSRVRRRFDLTLRLASDAGPLPRGGPPPVRMSSGDGWLCGIFDPANYVLVNARQRRALVSVSAAMLRFPYHVRYEMIEFATFTLLARGAGLVPLHAACIGVGARGVLLLGDSGAGKSTLCGEALRAGWHFLSEDSVFVTPQGLDAFGIANFLHLRHDSPHLRRSGALARRARASPEIRRRSGVRKLEVDLRKLKLPPAPGGLRLAAIVVLRRARAAGGTPLVALGRAATRRLLTRSQPYATRAPQWRHFLQRAGRLTAFELRRTAPEAALAALRPLLNTRR